MYCTENRECQVSSEPDCSLTIDFTEVLGYQCSASIRPWNEGISWASTTESGTILHEYDEEFPVPFALLKTDKRAKPWVESIPREVQALLEEYEEKYWGVLYSTLWFISRDNHAYEYFLNQPRLAWFLLRHAKLNNWHELYIFYLFTQKRKTVLEACCIPSKKSCLSYISKLNFQSFGRSELDLICNTLITSEHIKYFHVKTIDENIIRFVDFFPELSSSRFLKQYNGQWDLMSLRQTIVDIKRIAGSIGIENINRRLCNCRDLDSISKLHDRLSDKMNKQEVKSVSDIYYPQPPIRGSDEIIPISCLKELIIEGQEQRHCVKSYHETILNGEYYVYRVIRPERATLGLTKTNSGNWQIDQIALKNNKTPLDDTYESIKLWYEAGWQ
jgi:hypothetical protein